MSESVKLSPVGWVAKQAALYEESGGTKGVTQGGAPCLLLDYLGRRSGVWRRTVLIYGRDGDDYLVVASNSGSDDEPLWLPSLRANPAVRLRVGPERFDAVAETLSADEKARVWPHLVEVFPRWDIYQRGTSRDIAVVRLTRAG
ncbi:deazaflavin-dependent oxidoreductase (nitroreductase family) [Allocatelliglobosispora scoriae]|uniref:Deazaflavin-dependent oxidoreductase (Nitroreductase family) n=1 Tax=Allocatelliglobosispora scoriae TaxID=643052 RepID=A0A841BQJ4_9ACTN|nr:nitroreductase family deazaflavin-dependent oxidoreductase [Allocatelliglobosispora scoriae]MBB5869090.1 deazaflavin-dependent oxidoreductase (nitroreductase family) [Allocatelliglobosispora scoriae]